MSGALVQRLAARVLLLDGADRVLLFQGFDPHRPEAGMWWITPGGGVDDGESLEAAALRELTEETGISDAALGPCVWTRTAAFEFEGDRYLQREWFFIGRTNTKDVDSAGFTAIERRSVTGHRWWTVAELLATDDVIYPSRFGELVQRLLTEGPPAEPVEIG
jgi:8-oxo-dGTP pyrophosphatase MutT (NUDIX family)